MSALAGASDMDGMWTISWIVAWGLAVAQGLTLVALACKLGQIQLRATGVDDVPITDDGPAIHRVMPAVEGQDIDGRRVRPADFEGREWVLLFLETDCSPCVRLLQKLPAALKALPRPTPVLLVVEGPRGDVERLLRLYWPSVPALVDPPGAIRAGLAVERTPYGFLIDAEGVVRMKGVINHGEHLESLIRRRGRHVSNLEWTRLSDVQPMT